MLSHLVQEFKGELRFGGFSPEPFLKFRNTSPVPAH